MIGAGPIAVIGAGAWGTALANVAAHGDRPVILWTRAAPEAARMATERTNALRLPGIALAPSIMPTADLALVADCRIAILATPAQTTRAMADLLAPALPAAVPLIVTAKGIDRQSGSYPRALLERALPGRPAAVLSGPSFASDVAAGLPTAVVLAAEDEALARSLAEALSTPSFRCYHGSDPHGVEIGGAAKNVLAIAAGIVAGRRLGESARAALTARGFAELMRFARASGGRPDTLMGLAGLGDLVLSAASSRSRNFAFGEALGAGESLADAARRGLAEGVYTADILVRKAGELGVEMPIASAVSAVVDGRAGIDEAVAALMRRPLKDET